VFISWYKLLGNGAAVKEGTYNSKYLVGFPFKTGMDLLITYTSSPSM